MEDNYIQIKHLIMRIYDRIADLQDVMLQFNQYNITINEIHILEKLKNNDGINVKTLAGMCNVTTATMTIQIKKLESNKYVIKEKDPNDLRGLIIRITDKGKKIVKTHEYFYIKLLKGILKTHKKEDIDLMYSMLSEIEGNLNSFILKQREKLQEKK